MSSAPPEELSAIDRAELELAEGRSEEALRRYLTLMEQQPGQELAWLRAAQLLARLGSKQPAATALEQLAPRLARQGELLLALVAVKELLALDEPAGREQLKKLGELYGADSPLVDRRRRSAPPPLPAAPGEEAGRLAEASDARVLRELAEEALVRAAEQPAPEPPTRSSLPYCPILSDLPAADYEALVPLLTPRTLAPGAVIIEQESEGTSFFMVVRGKVLVSRLSAAGEERQLAHLYSGAFFGEMALLTDNPRIARVVAERPTLLLELERAALEKVAQRTERVAQVLADYTRERLLRNLLATSPLFAPLAPERQEALLSLFESQVYQPGEALLREGDEATGLKVVLSGAVEVSRMDQGERLLLAKLGPGQLIGEISLIQQRPATATVTALHKAVILALPQEVLNQQVEQFPEVVAHAYKLALQREQANSQMAEREVVPVEEHLLLV